MKKMKAAGFIFALLCIVLGVYMAAEFPARYKPDGIFGIIVGLAWFAVAAVLR